MKRLYWLLIILAFTSAWLIYTIINFDPTCHMPPTENTTENLIRVI